MGGGTIGAPNQGALEGPNSPLLEFRRNLPSADPREGLDKASRIVEMDRPCRDFMVAHGGGVFKYAPMLHFASDAGAIEEMEGWILARICVARAGGSTDAPAVRARLLEAAAPLIPAWAPELAERQAKAAEALKTAAPAAKPLTAPAP